jgi:hypothetical protein
MAGGCQRGAEQDPATDRGSGSKQEADRPPAPGGAAEGADGERQPIPWQVARKRSTGGWLRLATKLASPDRGEP